MAKTKADKVKFDKEADVKPLADSLRKVFGPLIKAMPKLALIPKEIKRIGDKLDQDIMSGVPERVENVVEKFSMNFGAKMLDIIEDGEAKRLKIEKAAALERQQREEELSVLRSRGATAEIQENRVVQLNSLQIQEKQKENLKTQREIIQQEKEVIKLEDMGPGATDELVEAIKKLNQLQEKQQEQSEVLGRNRVDVEDTKMVNKVSGALEGTVLEEPFNAIRETITGLSDTFMGFAKPFVSLGKFAKKRIGISKEQNDLSNKNVGLMGKMNKAMLLTIGRYALIGVAIVGVLLAFAKLAEYLSSFFGRDSDAESSGQRRRKSREEKLGPTEERTGSMTGDGPAIVGRGGRKKIGDNESEKIDYSPLNMTESADDKLARLQGEQSKMERQQIVTNIYNNVVTDASSNANISNNPSVAKTGSGEGQALNPA